MSNRESEITNSGDITTILENIQNISQNLNIPGATNTYNINVYNSSTIYDNSPDNRVSHTQEHRNSTDNINNDTDSATTEAAAPNSLPPVSNTITSHPHSSHSISNTERALYTDIADYSELGPPPGIFMNRSLRYRGQENINSLSNTTNTSPINSGNNPPPINSSSVPLNDSHTAVYSFNVTEPVNNSNLSFELEGISDTLSNSITDMLNNMYTRPVNNSVSLSVLNTNTNIRLFSDIRDTINDEESLEEKCHICNVEYTDNDILRVNNSCGHYLHQVCIDHWYSNHNKCPICNQILDETNNPI